MTLTLNVSDDLKPEEASELVDIAREQGKSVGHVLLEAARDVAAKRREAAARRGNRLSPLERLNPDFGGLDPMQNLRRYFARPVFLRTTRGHLFLYHLSSLAMCLMVLLKVWIMLSTWSAESAIDWVQAVMILAAAEIMTMIHAAVSMPAAAVPKLEGGES